MRLLTVTHFFESHGGGIERVAGELCRALAVAGHQPVWAASDADERPSDPRIEVLPLACINPTEHLTGLPMPIPLPRSIAALKRAVSLADAVIVHDALYATSLAAAHFARCLCKPVILVQHIAAIPFAGSFLRMLMRAANRLVTQPMLCNADQVIFISDTVRAHFAHVSMRRSPRLIFNGVNTDLFSPGNKLRGAFGLPENERVAVFVGRFVEKKGLSVLRELARMRPDISFALAGFGPIDPAAWGLPNIRVLGRLNRGMVADLFRSADLLILPSIGEGYPLVIQEAMACGLPVVCGEESARADPVAANWLHGVPVDLAKPTLTAQHVVRAIDDMDFEPENRRQMARYAVSNYNWAGMAAEVGRIASSLTNPLAQ
ncbi:glycosyltransferase family 4 protein [Sphingobium fuliginis]|uniref:Glycosyltransferase family 4 protein n=1 Tax=Sphingobium fuliginis ATCC 27551 TaxID=1208342 RepID=A0A5B8CIE8_SPHSA|nr:glycosyltransferase family 4 protein [Sphingobium fuliginis]QDC38056.1 glycosyltransferase family 4 protein [Sphingobium fuliginis ATCC 27551]